MDNFEQLVPEHIRRLNAYAAGKPIKQAERETGVRCIKMASNENPFGPSPRALQAMRAAAAEANFYPDNDSTELRQKLAQRNELSPDQVLVTAGSTSLLDLIARTLLAPGLNAVTSQRSFIVYPIVTRAAGAQLIEAPMKNDAYDLDAVSDAIDSNTRLLYLANPNNPTGTVFDAPALERFLERVPEHVIVILDEAYFDFAQHFARRDGFHYSRSLNYIREGRNVVVLRTFSKAHGLAGLRVGYGMGPAALLANFARVRPAFSVSALAEAGAAAALDDEAHVQKAVENNAAGAAWLNEQLVGLGFRVPPSCANFLYFDVGEDATAFAKRLEKEGVIVRPLSAWGIPTAIRVTIGTPEQNALFIDALKKAMAGAAVGR